MQFFSNLFCRNRLYNMYRNCCSLILYSAELQANKSILSITGQDTCDYLQGLLTNNIFSLTFEKNKALYSLILNDKGRVLYDIILYRKSDVEYFIECDSLVVGVLLRHLNFYKVKRKVSIKQDNSYQVWNIYNPNINESSKLLPINAPEDLFSNIEFITVDPRLEHLGYKVLLPSGISLFDISPCLKKDNLYTQFRYRLGIGEGSKELIQGKSLPLEMNGDYLNGISFDKGCYIGQELTARTFHTGVVRKRLMPVLLEKEVSLTSNENIKNENGKVIGKVIQLCGVYGICLMRIAEALSSETLTLCSVSVKAAKPFWWPL